MSYHVRGRKLDTDEPDTPFQQRRLEVLVVRQRLASQNFRKVYNGHNAVQLLICDVIV